MVSVDDDPAPDATPWHDKPWFLIAALGLIVGLITYTMWPLNENALRAEAERLLQEDSRSAWTQAKLKYLEPMLKRFPDGEHAQWGREQIDRVDVELFLHQLSVKKKNNIRLANEGERLHVEAIRYQQVGDHSAALDKYRSIVTVLGEDPQYEVAVNAARQKIGEIESQGASKTEAVKIVQSKLDEADRLQEEGRVVEARKIWYSLIELYGNNSELAPLVAKAQSRLMAQPSAETLPSKEIPVNENMESDSPIQAQLAAPAVVMDKNRTQETGAADAGSQKGFARPNDGIRDVVSRDRCARHSAIVDEPPLFSHRASRLGNRGDRLHGNTDLRRRSNRHVELAAVVRLDLSIRWWTAARLRQPYLTHR